MNGSNMDCEIIRDLMPLYVDELCSPKSCQLVESHVSACENCRVKMEQMQKPDIKIKHSIEPMKMLKKQIRKHTLSVVLIWVVIAVAAISLIQGKFYLQPGDEMGYVILNFYLLIPFVSFVCSLFLGMRDSWLKWISPIVFGILNGIAPLIVSNSYFEWFLFAMAFIPSCVGVGVGIIIMRAIRNNKRNRYTQQ